MLLQLFVKEKLTSTTLGCVSIYRTILQRDSCDSRIYFCIHFYYESNNTIAVWIYCSLTVTLDVSGKCDFIVQLKISHKAFYVSEQFLSKIANLCNKTIHSFIAEKILEGLYCLQFLLSKGFPFHFSHERKNALSFTSVNSVINAIYFMVQNFRL